MLSVIPECFPKLCLSLSFTSLTRSPGIVCKQKITRELAQRVPINPLSDMPILGFSNSAANKDMMSKIWTKWGLPAIRIYDPEEF